VLIECQPRLESALEYALGEFLPLTVPATTSKGTKVRTKHPMYHILMEYCNAVEFALERDVLSERFHGKEPAHCTNVRRMWFLWKYLLDWSMATDNFVLLRQQVPSAERFMDYAAPDFDDSEAGSAIQNALAALTRETQISVDVEKIVPRRLRVTDTAIRFVGVHWYSEAILKRLQLASGCSDPVPNRGDDDFTHSNFFCSYDTTNWIPNHVTAVVYSMQMLAMLFIMRCGLISIPLQTRAVTFAMDLFCMEVEETIDWVDPCNNRLVRCDEFTPLIIHILARCGNAQALKNIMQFVDNVETPITWVLLEEWMTDMHNVGYAHAMNELYPRCVPIGLYRCKRVKAMNAMFTEFAQKVEHLNPMCNQSLLAIRAYNCTCIRSGFLTEVFGEELYPWWDAKLHDGAYDGVVGDWTAGDDKELEKPFVPIPMPVPSDDESLDALGRPDGDDDREDGKENAEPQSPLSDAQRAGLGGLDS